MMTDYNEVPPVVIVIVLMYRVVGTINISYV